MREKISRPISSVPKKWRAKFPTSGLIAPSCSKKQRPPDRRKAALWAFCFSWSSFPHRFVKSRDRASLGLLVLLWQVTGKLNGSPGRYSRAARFFSRHCTLLHANCTFFSTNRTFCAFSITKRGIFARFPASSSTFQIARVELIFRAAVKL